MINVPKEIIKDSFPYLIMCVISAPIVFIISGAVFSSITDLDVSAMPPELKAQYDQVRGISGTIPLVMIGIVLLFSALRSNAFRIIRTANIEKRMEKLKKMGHDEFIKQTKAVLIDTSNRGNSLYETDQIIQGRKLKFLVYPDVSTDRKYISFVEDRHIWADEAMASKFSLSEPEYAMLKKENES